MIRVVLVPHWGEFTGHKIQNNRTRMFTDNQQQTQSFLIILINSLEQRKLEQIESSFESLNRSSSIWQPTTMNSPTGNYVFTTTALKISASRVQSWNPDPVQSTTWILSKTKGKPTATTTTTTCCRLLFCVCFVWVYRCCCCCCCSCCCCHNICFKVT